MFENASGKVLLTKCHPTTFPSSETATKTNFVKFAFQKCSKCKMNIASNIVNESFKPSLLIYEEKS